MRRLCVLVGLLAVAGCTLDADRGPFADAMKDARGDNMRMRSELSPLTDATDGPRLRTRD
jgi:hypothetical protein